MALKVKAVSSIFLLFLTFGQERMHLENKRKMFFSLYFARFSLSLQENTSRV